MIWSTATHVGMAFAISSSGATYVVARYSPAGNTLDESPQQASARGRGGHTPTHNFPPYHQPAVLTLSGNVHQGYSRYGQQRHRGQQSRYGGRRAHEETFGNKEDPLPNPPYARPSPSLSRPPSSRRMPVSHTDPYETLYGSPYSRRPQASWPYGGGLHASVMPPVDHRGYRSSRDSASLCCAVM